ncbi:MULTISPECIES: hypothetical protein [unclassified Streptomyces]|uniref:hypothetical protein n=1 Tax=unclassified Streptomyces TaxID=2593676 RepID=UPI002366B0A6|nr:MULTISPECIES: hypothetical protein [unclassified Streptomyces]MDF3140188.1 hypothetical protein [Streptomyces sp. T21Q-yed]WDF41702.1 hypothetical protein PBV52_35370 [Streptomyces sp. T12]
MAPDVAQVLKHNRTLLYRHIAARLALAAALFAVPFVAHLVGYDAALPAFGIPAAMFVLIFLALRLRHGSRLKACEKVLRTYPLEYRTRVSKKGSEWKYLGDVHTVRLSVRGQHGAPSLRAVNASTVRRWPKEAEEGGAWFAGDPAFGGVMIVPVSNNMLFVQPADWQKYEQERAAADRQRRALAEQAGISGLLEKEPNIMLGGVAG